ncbi:hypothetical protein SNEBB_010799 [Seison nebaliae]|nr:hypothetical protein SNEBB_010799 [Seison nebaliae]
MKLLIICLIVISFFHNEVKGVICKTKQLHEYYDGEYFLEDCNICLCKNGQTFCNTQKCDKAHAQNCYQNGMSWKSGLQYHIDDQDCSCWDGQSMCTHRPQINPLNN